MEHQTNARLYSLFVVILLAACDHVGTNEYGSREKREASSMSAPLSNDERISFLATHNKFRGSSSKPYDGKRQPEAGGMKRMYWSVPLEAEAIAWSRVAVALYRKDSSKMPHGLTNLTLDPEFRQMLGFNPANWISSNIYRGLNPDGMTEVDGARATTAWYNETKYFTFGTQACVGAAACGHYVQVMWESSKYLGCGWDRINSTFYFAICNYYPGGKPVKADPYRTGLSCGLCSEYKDDGFTDCDGELCAPADRCSAVKECKVVDTEYCLCSDDDYKKMVNKFLVNSISDRPSNGSNETSTKSECLQLSSGTLPLFILLLLSLIFIFIKDAFE